MRTVAATVLVGALAFAACGSDAPSDNSGKPTSTTLDAKAAALAYTQPGPHKVGVATLTLSTGGQADVWYPTDSTTGGKVTYDVRDFLPPSIKSLLKGNLAASYTIDGERDAAAASGTFPIVLFSHGFSGIRDQSSFLTSHLASWGMVVAAPDHSSRDLFHALQFQFGQGDDIADLRATLAAVEGDARFSGHLDTAKIAAVGHSAGGGTVLNAARVMPEITGYVSLASGRLSAAGPGTTTTTPPPMPAKPSLFVAGANDQVVSLDKVTKPSFAAAAAPTRLWVIDKSGHNVFDDFCTLGGGKGIIGLAEASGLGPLLDTGALKQFKQLGQDGCLPPNAPVADAWPAIEHVVTAWLRLQFGQDKAPGVGLEQPPSGVYKLAVTVSGR